MAEKTYTIEELLTILTESPTSIATATTGLTAAQLRMRPTEEEWSINEVLAHLRSCGDMWGDAMATIIAQDHPTIRAVNPTTWIKQTDYPEQAFAPSFHAYTTQRTALLMALKSLDPDAWSRTATVTGAGRPLVLTVHSYATRLARHERPHVKQITRIAAAIKR